jgi:hypothetical protein
MRFMAARVKLGRSDRTEAGTQMTVTKRIAKLPLCSAAAISESSAPLESHQIDVYDLVAPLTPEERSQAIAALEEARQIREELLAARDGKLFPSGGAELRKLRAERTRQLP